ncbi:outer membrane protein TolC [Larkinella arboricola]|uniref:Outer membrane protein TolC n=1 Tax=Larkinella arboricola TaxID=643671 RepID=A0A327WXR4_LARAB|nr:TolC family protein [Larkinella arboricola]RAJ97969.1 outer membrane protein TolC [Larkinella arboricola]
MKPYHTLLIFLTLRLISALPASAQPRSLTMQSAVGLALEKNRDLQVATLETARATEKVREARSYALPTVSASAQYMYFPLKQVSFLPGSFVGLGENDLATFRVGGSNALLGGVAVSQPLFQAGIGSGIRAAQIFEKASAEERNEVRATVVTDVKKAYLDVLITQEQLRLQQQSLARNEQALKDARSLLAQGRASRVDTLRAFVSVENLRPEIIRLTNRVEITKTVLKRTVGLDERETVELQDSLNYDPVAFVAPGTDAFLDAVQARPEVHRLELTEKLNREQIALQTAERAPKLSAIGLLQSQAQANHLRVDQYSWPLSSYIGLQLNIPIFSGFRTVSRIQQAVISRQQSETQLLNLKEIVRAQVKISLSTVEESRLRIATQQQTVTVAELGYRITRDRWKQGIASRLDLSDAELSLTQAKSNYLQAIYDYLTATVELDKVLGRIQF